jgi:hypothetical protein
VAIADLAAAMGKRRVSDLSVARNEVINKGLLYASEPGQLAFTVPGCTPSSPNRINVPRDVRHAESRSHLAVESWLSEEVAHYVALDHLDDDCV